MGRTRRGLLVGAVVVAAGLLALLAVMLTRHGSDSAAGEQQKGDGPTPTADAHQQARQVATALTKLATDPSTLVAAGARSEVEGRAAQAVPKGSKVTPEPATWAPDGAGGGVMTVTVASPGRPAVSYAVVMVHESGGWKVLATWNLPDARSTTTTTTGAAS